MSRWSNYAADEYVTSDGRKFSNHHDADNHEKMLDDKNKSSSGPSKPVIDWSTYNSKGYQYYESGDYQKAIENYNTALNMVLGEYNRAAILRNRGIAYHAMGDRRQAITNCTAAADIYFSLFEDEIFGGSAVKKYGEIEGEGGFFSKIGYDSYVPAAPKSQKEIDSLDYAYKGTHIMYFDESENKDYEKAIEYFTQAINIFPGYNHYISRGNAYTKNKNYEAAMADYNEALRALGETDSEEAARIYLCRANVYADIGNNEAAIAEYKKAADFDNDIVRIDALSKLEKLGVQYTPKPFVPKPKKSVIGSSGSSSPSGSSNSSTANTAGTTSGKSGKGGFLGAIVGAIAAGMILNFSIINLIIGGVIGYFVPKIFVYIALIVGIVGVVCFGGRGCSFDSQIDRIKSEISASIQTVTVTADALNMRTSPDGNADVVKSIPKGAVLTVTGEAQNNWLPVSHEGASGWVSKRYVSDGQGESQRTESPAQTQSAQPAQQNQAQTQPAEPTGNYGITMAKDVYAPGEVITVNYTVSQKMVQDQAWVALYRANAAHANYGVYKYVTATTGELTFNAPVEHGAHEIRLYKQHSPYNDETLVMKRTFRVE